MNDLAPISAYVTCYGLVGIVVKSILDIASWYEHEWKEDVYLLCT